MEKKKPIIIKARKRPTDYVYDGYVQLGNRVIIPYRDRNLLMRCIREIWFRLHLPGRRWWYNPELKAIQAASVTVCDPLITPDFLAWLCDLHSNTQFTVSYSNKVNRASIKPTDLSRPNLCFVSFDTQDCEEYGMPQTHPGYLAQYSFTAKDKLPTEYDVIFLGRDKGRAEQILDYQKQFEQLGLKTNFRICADRAYLRFKRRIYQKEIPYYEYVELLKKTKAHLNLVQEGQTSITQRDLESVFDEVKCITNNRGIKEFELYDPTRFFVLGVDDMTKLTEFLNVPFKPVPEEKLAEYGSRTI